MKREFEIGLFLLYINFFILAIIAEAASDALISPKWMCGVNIFFGEIRIIGLILLVIMKGRMVVSKNKFIIAACYNAL